MTTKATERKSCQKSSANVVTSWWKMNKFQTAANMSKLVFKTQCKDHKVCGKNVCGNSKNVVYDSHLLLHTDSVAQEKVEQCKRRPTRRTIATAFLDDTSAQFFTIFKGIESQTLAH
jgi:hypothetical protein